MVVVVCGELQREHEGPQKCLAQGGPSDAAAHTRHAP